MAPRCSPDPLSVPLSVLMKGETLPPLTHWHGIPCERIKETGASKNTTDATMFPALRMSFHPAA